MSNIDDFMDRITIIKNDVHVHLGDYSGFIHFLGNISYTDYYFDRQRLEFIEQCGEKIDGGKEFTIFRNTETDEFYKCCYYYYNHHGIDLDFMDVFRVYKRIRKVEYYE